jgi:hypothetical protein
MMVNAARCAALVACLAASFSCSSAAEPPLLPTYRGNIGGNVPAVRGQLVIDESRCLALRLEESTTSLPLVWPSGYSVEQGDEDTWEVVREEGAFTLSVGSTLSVAVKRVSGAVAREMSPGEPGSKCLKGESLLVEAVPIPE